MSVPEILVEVGFAAVDTGVYWHIGDSSRGKIGTAAIGPDAGLWTSVTGDVKSISIRYGANRVESPIIRYEAGTAVIVFDNGTRDYDPTNLGGPYVVAGQTQITPMRQSRVRATWDGITYDLWRGYADDWIIDYNGPHWSQTTMTATDGTKVLAAYDRVASGAVGSGEDTGARVDRILTSVGWATSDRVIATGDSTMQATTLEGDALSEIRAAVEAEAGEFYIDPAGRAFFRNRLAMMEDARSANAQTIFGDSAGELPYTDVRVTYDDSQLANLVRITRTGGAEQTAQDATSQAAYLTRTYVRSGLPLESDTEASNHAHWVLYQSKDPELRFAELIVAPRRVEGTELETEMWHQVLERRIGDRITIIRRPPGGGDPIERDVFIRGIAHEIRPGLEWRTTWTLQSATKYSFWTIGHSDLGRIGYNAIAY